MPDRGTTFFFGSWVCIANGSGGFDSHLANSREPEAFPVRRSNAADDHVGNLSEMMIPDLAREIEQKLIFDASSTRSSINLRSEST